MAYPPRLSGGPGIEDKRWVTNGEGTHLQHRHSLSGPLQQFSPPEMSRLSSSPTKNVFTVGGSARPSPRVTRNQKQISFELILEDAKARARLPMRVMISRQDTIESIVTGVKNFYGLYEKPGLSFHDAQGNLLTGYDDFHDGMIVFVKIINDPLPTVEREVPTPVLASPKRPKLGPPIELRPTQGTRTHAQASDRSPSPGSFKSVQSATALTGAKSRAKSQRALDSHGSFDASGDAFSDSDTGNGSVTSSRRSRAEAHASAEISVDNIVEGGRRKRAKFESSELPLFVPPQVPITASISSVSPQRKNNNEMASPMPYTNQRTFMYNQTLPSPQSFGRSDLSYTAGSIGGTYNQAQQQGGHQLRGRPMGAYQQTRRSIGGILPTPEPTVGSVISDEDVALQLMRLGDATAFSQGRTSTSTMDDALSGKADAASSEDDEEGDSDEIKQPKRRKTSHAVAQKTKNARSAHVHSDSGESSGDDYHDDSFKGDSDEVVPDADNHTGHRRGSHAHAGHIHVEAESRNGEKKPKSSKPKSKSTGEQNGDANGRKTSIAVPTVPLGPDEEDLSSRPRCQRCRKSKKGCDRQRPCGRCKDAGIGIDGCVSEDEGNGRRGRFGRHMGVAVKKDIRDVPHAGPGAMSPPVITPLTPTATSPGTFLMPAVPTDKSKKRKRP